MKSLLHMTFSNYNKMVPPRHHYDQPINVTVRLVVPYIESLDVKNQLLKFVGVFNLVWTDYFLQWDPAQYDGINTIVVPRSLVWFPNFMIVNAKNDPLDSNGDEQIVNVQSDGTVLYTPRASLEVPCTIDVSKFPYDHHICGPSVSLWMFDNTSVHLMAPQTGINLEQMSPNGQFDVTPKGVLAAQFDYNGRFFDSLHFQLEMTRRPVYMTLTILIPVFLISLLEGVSLVMSPQEPERLSISITILLSFTVFLGIINENLPETSEHISLIVVYVTALQLLAFLVVIGNAIVYSVHYKSSRLNGMSDKRHASSSTCLRHTKISPAKEISETSENEANSECASDVCVVTPVRRPSKMASSAEKLNTYFVVTHIVLFMLVTSVTLVISFLT
ncbi:neuronal acetylcholine receptor subunit alpha-6-like [Biomphalaria glabrata]|uniref:Neuronal acetylcholine receptor subunit alpha-6-like n=1 Tax=Biomphalaria glabrata TaxID=6526 RepID=A0A9W3B789_BIOGL|nr:neuronal acetylcholine receptor subunit alpha-6-like [Biomphalaria glabrata]